MALSDLKWSHYHTQTVNDYMTSAYLVIVRDTLPIWHDSQWSGGEWLPDPEPN